MKKETLSNEYRARIFAKYIGCMVKYPSTDGTDKPTVTARLTKVGFDEIETTYKRVRNRCKGDIISMVCNHHKCDILHTKLILSPLSEITDEHLEKVGEMLGYVPAACLREGRYFIEIWGHIRADVPTSEVLILTDYLRSHGYDLDNLIPQNLAITK